MCLCAGTHMSTRTRDRGCQVTVWDPVTQKGCVGVRSQGEGTSPQRDCCFQSPVGQQLTSFDPPECSQLQNSTGQETNAGDEIVWFKVTQGERTAWPKDLCPLPPVPVCLPSPSILRSFHSHSLPACHLSPSIVTPFFLFPSQHLSWCRSLNTGPCACWVCTCPPAAPLALPFFLLRPCVAGRHSNHRP